MIPDLLETAQLRRRLPSPAMRRAIRQSSAASQAKVATAIGVTRAAVANWESGRREPGDEFLPRYLEVLEALQQIVSGAE